uniref:Uncharacterized protein n=1 Tax=viral metagenome TaxID=1070528 RepID=A0A6C0I155_9ZZZZ
MACICYLFPLMSKKSCSVANTEANTEANAEANVDMVDINTNKIYYELLISIRNYEVLSMDDLYYIDTLPKCNLIEIIKIYNLHMTNINELIK